MAWNIWSSTKNIRSIAYLKSIPKYKAVNISEFFENVWMNYNIKLILRYKAANILKISKNIR